jgi:2-polyprenyl-3-methyl-5-hydroxy-6-metoxy-1,4-benzoquinol methylase
LFGRIADAEESREYIMSQIQSSPIVSPRTHELLLESAPLVEDWAAVECRSKPTGGMEEWAKTQSREERQVTSCEWYHGTWQYLRLFDLVAVPGWHAFFTTALASVLERTPHADVLISAAADYGMLATLHEAIEVARARPRIVLYDICKTPLRASQWYADRHQLALECVCANLLTADIPEAPFDLIVTDEFLSVVKASDKPRVVRRWRELLRPGGTVVTTVMIGGPTTPALRRGYDVRARRLVETLGAMVDRYENGRQSALLERFTRFADLHTRHMVRGEDEVGELFADYAALSCRRVATPGECVNPTDSVQIVATVAA